VLLAATKNSWRAVAPLRTLQPLPDRASTFKEVALAAVAQRGRSLAHASPTLRADREVVLAAARNDTLSLEFAAPELLDSAPFVLACIEAMIGWRGLAFASPAVRARRDVLVAALTKFGPASSESGDLVKLASEALRADKDLVR